MVNGEECILIDIQLEEGFLLKPILQNLNNGRKLEYEHPTATRMGQHLKQRDMFENISVYISQSRVQGAGEGLFAKSRIQKENIICFFNGVRKRKLFRTVAGVDEEFSDYRIELDYQISLDVPDQFTSISSYNATLGHKACHSFNPNSYFSQVYHPRFGEIISLIAYRDILEGEEILVNYGYNFQERISMVYGRRAKVRRISVQLSCSSEIS
ncbi:histone-lysine N-methyltransferase SETD7 isoform X2 [Eurytemora carolleeae]|uniref:histone-lysine N-methyltransferase SETD7 isoform X2 n=1 Tax=Eurytemora carolleeae TaxID=1294199 RepID=UPI000C773828|nr:histone-lysine N-methyltransferase SETD7 isoform X2 [Eurytemora carolleeae]|eukprot:XP_023347759.1 histone-lysine N-methyltransferase SETD7-like isoform X2 [Eurytemora affinis]